METEQARCGAPFEVPQWLAPTWANVVSYSDSVRASNVFVRGAIACLALVGSAWVCPRSAEADGLTVYPPEEQDAVYALEVHGAAIVPLERSTLCPSGADCVFGGGFGVGGLLLRRSPDGIGLLVGYEVWLLDGGGVYEIAALHALRLGLRWTLDVRSRVQPFLQATAAALLLTDPGQATSGGGGITVGGGMEIEMTADVSFALAAELAFLSVGAFQTRDGVLRARDFGVNVALEMTAGLVIVLGSTGAR
jgi:hypothetical protein